MYDVRRVDKYYYELNSSQLVKNSHLENIVALYNLKAKRRLMRNLEFKSWEPDRILRVSKFPELTNLNYLPGAILKNPYLSKFFLPSFANFGGIGVVLVEKEVRRCFPANDPEKPNIFDVLMESFKQVQDYTLNTLG